MVRNSHQDALTDAQFDKLVAAAETLEPPFDAEAMLILYAGGRLGMRAGEICHLNESWIDWERKHIEVPRYDSCDCGYCRQQARQTAEAHDDLSYEEALAERWNPKTRNSARAIPFDFDPDVEAVITAFFADRDEYEHSRVSVNRRVDRVAEAAGIPTSSIYPHALRATAATNLAYRGLGTAPLQNFFGWHQISTAQKYIRLSGSATADALRDVYSD